MAKSGQIRKARLFRKSHELHCNLFVRKVGLFSRDSRPNKDNFGSSLFVKFLSFDAKLKLLPHYCFSKTEFITFVGNFADKNLIEDFLNPH